jgi:predicted RNase H-like nuclease (RuvC/YqgF family)
MLVLASLGCENQQPVIDLLNKEKAEIEQQLTKASEQASQLATENTAMQQGLEAAKKAAQLADHEAQKLVTEANGKMAELQKQLDEAKARIAELEAAAN